MILVTFRKADATALGDAFHRLAQRAIDSSSAYILEAPDADSIAAQVSLHSLTLKQQSRLENALKIWLGSDCAQSLPLMSIAMLKFLSWLLLVPNQTFTLKEK